MSFWRPGLPPGGVPSLTEIRAQSIQAGNGPISITTNFYSSLDRWTTVDDRTGTLRDVFGNSICRIWTQIGGLDPTAEYNMEVRCVVRDVDASPMFARVFLVPGGTVVSVPVVPVQFGATVETLGAGTNQELTFSAALDPDDTPTRLLVEVVSGSATVPPESAYLIYDVTVTITEV
jgi:hypothetical protein